MKKLCQYFKNFERQSQKQMMKIDKYILHFQKAVMKMVVEKVFLDLKVGTKYGTGLTLA